VSGVANERAGSDDLGVIRVRESRWAGALVIVALVALGALIASVRSFAGSVGPDAAAGWSVPRVVVGGPPAFAAVDTTGEIATNGLIGIAHQAAHGVIEVTELRGGRVLARRVAKTLLSADGEFGFDMDPDGGFVLSAGVQTHYVSTCQGGVTGCYQLQATIVSPEGKTIAQRLVSPRDTDARLGALAIDPKAGVLLIWNQGVVRPGPSGFGIAYAPPGRSFTATRHVDADLSEDTEDLGVGTRHRWRVSWFSYDVHAQTIAGTSLMQATVARDGSVGRPSRVLGGFHADLGLGAYAPGGGFTAVLGSGGVIRIVQRPISGRFGPVQTIARDWADRSPFVAVGPGGAAAVAWYDGQGSLRLAQRGAGRQGAATFNSPRTVIAHLLSRREHFDPEVALSIDAAGDTLLAWTDPRHPNHLYVDDCPLAETCHAASLSTSATTRDGGASLLGLSQGAHEDQLLWEQGTKIYLSSRPPS
jgi:hypothetical protein